MDRRDFLTAWFQLLLMAIFPWLRERTDIGERISRELVGNISVDELNRWTSYVQWNMARAYSLKWGQIWLKTNLVDRDELVARYR